MVAANFDGMDQLPAVPALDPQASQEVTGGVRAVTQNARRAFDFFARELPMAEAQTKEN